MAASSKRRTPRSPLAILALLALALALPATAQTHLDNPFLGARMYVNPDYTARADATAAAMTDAALAGAMRAVGRQPTAIWLDRIAIIPSMVTHLDRALAADSDLVLFVLYDLPDRDCMVAQEVDELEATPQDLARYRTEFIDAIAAIARQPRYAGLRLVFVVEPNSLPNLVTNLSDERCARVQATGAYVDGVRYAVNTLHAIPNAYLYLDLAHSAWLGWRENASRMVTVLDGLASGFTDGKGAIDGFATNVKQYIPLHEPNFAWDTVVGGHQVWTARFYEYDPQIEESTYAADMWSRLTAAGWPETIGVLVDTSRNGWGGRARPPGPSSSSDVDEFVKDSKIDRRAHRGLWCNVAGAGLGERPGAAPPGTAGHYDAYVWIKSPGESDGAPGPGNPMCDPGYQTLYGVHTGALPGGPYEGEWFGAAFRELVENAYPPIVEPALQTLTVTVDGGGSVVSTPAGIACGSACSASFPAGASVTLTAAAVSAVTTFTGWSGACAGTSPTCVVTMDQPQLVRAAFVDQAGVPVSVTLAGTGSGTVTGGGLSCPGTCTVAVALGTTVTLTAAPDPGQTFTGWSGACAGASARCVLTASGSVFVTASFARIPTYTLTVQLIAASGASGTVSSTPAGIGCGPSCSAQFPSGTVVTLTAVPGAGARFAGWGADCDGSTPTCTLSMTGGRVATAAFESTATPCANPITFSWNTGNFNTTGPVCYRTSQKVNGWGCSGFTGRTVSVNGGAAAQACGAGPLPLARNPDGYTYFSISAGSYAWASLYAW